MVSVETRLSVARPASEVFAFLADQLNAPRWQRGLLEVRRITPGPISVGTEHEFVRRFAGRTLVSRNRFLEFEAGRYVRFAFGSGSAGDDASGEGSYRVEPSDPGSCLVTSHVSLRLGGVGRFLGPVVRWILARDTARDERTLKALLERSPG